MPHTRGEPLTERELDVLRRVAAGFTHAAVAEQLGVVPGTVTAHLDAIYEKLGVHSREEAATVAATSGLL